MNRYTLSPQRYTGFYSVSEPCSMGEHDLFSVYATGFPLGRRWIADFSPHEHELAQSFVTWRNNAESLFATLPEGIKE